MNYKDLKDILVVAANPTASKVNFSDAQSAAKNAINKYFGIEDMSLRSLNRHKNEIFEIINEVVDEVLPVKIQDRTSDFAEIKKIARDQKAVFTVRTTNASRNRVARGIQKGARGGIYKARRLDGRDFTVDTFVESVGYMITLEEILTGTRTVAELVQILTNAWVEKIYIEVFNSLASAANSAPAVNKVTNGTTTIDNASLDKLIGIVSGYGVPRILGFRQHLALLGNEYIVGTGVARPDIDGLDVRNNGYVGVYKGTPVIELPNYIASHTDTKVSWVFDENKLFILPANEKPVKVVFQGESYTSEVAQPHGGVEYHQHRLMGIGVLFNQYIASYTLTDGWDAWKGE